MYYINQPEYQMMMHIDPGPRSHLEFHAWDLRLYPDAWPRDDANHVA